MSEAGTKHPFLDDLAIDAELSGTALRMPIRGRDNIRRVVDAVATQYISQTPRFLIKTGDRTFLGYDAELHDGQALQALAVIDHDADGSVPSVMVFVSPLSAALSLSAHLDGAFGAQTGQDTIL
jgi:hypothetical protein